MTAAPESARCRGMRDLDPDQMSQFRRIEQVFRSSCEGWGFREIRTPVIEHLHLFTSAGTLSPQMLGRVYSFLDWDGWSGERVVLRPDATIPAARLYCEQFTGDVAKWFYVENIFGFAGSDEQREVWQCGAELIGDAWPLADLEALAVVRGVLNALGIVQPTIRLSHTGVIRSILATAGYTPEEQLALYDRMLEGDPSVFPEIQTRLPRLSAPLGLLADLAGGQVAAIDNLRSAFAAQVPRMQEPLDELSTIAATLEARRCAYDIDLTMVRDFEYYTGPVFRVAIDGETLASGGRYDGLVASLSGNAVPACGFAIFMEAVAKHLPVAEAAALSRPVQVRPATSAPADLAQALDISSQLQQAGIAAALTPARDAALARWIVSLSERGLTLEDRRTGDSRETDSIAPILSLIQSESGL